MGGYLPPSTQEVIETVRRSDRRFYKLDPVVHYAITAAKQTLETTNIESHEFGVSIGSSRGATTHFESYHSDFKEKGKCRVQASPSTTLGNLSAWTAQSLKSSGVATSHSNTCSTALHSLANGIAWIRAGFVKQFLVGGAEACLTPFTFAQMDALGISQRPIGERYPSLAGEANKPHNAMCLGEGACTMFIQDASDDIRSTPALAHVIGLGFSVETITHGASMSQDAECLYLSMSRAIGGLDPSSIDIVITHTPGTIQGDRAEYAAINKVFGKHKAPLVTNNKWKIGHTFGASGALSIEMALVMLQHQIFIPLPYDKRPPYQVPIRRIMVNAAGFGGNAVSVILSAPS